jgi:zinc transporter ZupT
MGHRPHDEGPIDIRRRSGYIMDILLLIILGALTLFPPLTMMAVPYLRKRWAKRLLHPMLGISAGLLFGLVFLDILPEGFRLSNEMDLNLTFLGVAVLAGFFTLTIIEQYMLRKGLAHGHEAGGVKIKPFGTLGVAALSVHGFMDGFVIPIGLGASTKLGLVITIALVVHQIPDSFTAVSMALAAGYTKKKAAIFVLVTALDTPIGIVIGAIAYLGANAVGFANMLVLLSLGFSAGTFIFVSAADLIPELQHHSQSMKVTLFILVGFALVFALTMLIPA